MKGNRVVVTGLGAVTPLGLDVASSWAGICAGKSGAAMIDQLQPRMCVTTTNAEPRCASCAYFT